jgi:hypothetical protein
MTNYVLAHIHWKDTNAEEDVIIKLSCDYTPEEDEQIFFFCNGVEDLRGLMEEDNGQEFYVTDWSYCEL